MTSAAWVLTLWILASALFLTSDIHLLPSHLISVLKTLVNIFSYFQWEDHSGELITIWKSKGFLHLILPLTARGKHRAG